MSDKIVVGVPLSAIKDRLIHLRRLVREFEMEIKLLDELSTKAVRVPEK